MDSLHWGMTVLLAVVTVNLTRGALVAERSLETHEVLEHAGRYVDEVFQPIQLKDWVVDA